jgi:hypothetical protein
MPTLKELFKEKKLSSSGKTAEKTYKVRNSKEVPISSTVPLLNSTVFPFVQKNLRENPSLTNTKTETVLESELVGLRALKTLSFPVTYNKEILRLSRQTTNMVEFMKTAANGGESALASFERSGVIGKVIDKAEKLAEGALATLGIELPQKLIPSRVAYNQKLKKGLEFNTMTTLADIRKDGKGNLVGKFLQKNINIGPPKMKIKVGGAIIAEIKKSYREKLFGESLSGGKNKIAVRDLRAGEFSLNEKNVTNGIYSSKFFYGYEKGGTDGSTTVYPTLPDPLERNDLSSLLIEKINQEKVKEKGGDTSEKITFSTNAVAKLRLQQLSSSTLPFPINQTDVDNARLRDVKQLQITKKIREGLEGATKQAQKDLAKPENNSPSFQYNKEIPYSETIDEGIETDNIKLRNDLSTRLNILVDDGWKKGILGGKSSDSSTFISPTDQSIVSNARLNYVEQLQITKKIREGLEGATKQAQKDLAEPINNSPSFQYNKEIPYSETIDESIETGNIKLRNDLSTRLNILLADRLNKGILGGPQSGSLNRKNEINSLPVTSRQSKYGDRTDGISPFNSPTLDEKFPTGEMTDSNGVNRKLGDFINSKPPYEGETLAFDDGTTLDSKDFIPVKFTAGFGTKKSVNFTAIISGITETFTPGWDSGKFLGSPFEYYNYTGVGRSVSFDLELFSLNPAEHVIMWQKIDFLSSLVYPLGYDSSSTFVRPPIIAITIGDMYVKKMCHISSLSYTVDDDAGWEIGNLINDTSKKTIYGTEVDLKNYKLPRMVKVSITLQFMENRNDTETKKYGYNINLFTNNSIKNIN